MLRSSFCGIFEQNHSSVWLQITGILTTFYAVYSHVVALKFKGFGFMLTGKLLLFPLIYKENLELSCSQKSIPCLKV